MERFMHYRSLWRESTGHQWIRVTNTDYKTVFFVAYMNRELGHCGLVTPYGDIYLGQHWLR